jgi:DNA-binding GntR family transcriptional regulator
MPSDDFSNILVPPQKRSLADDIVDRLREAIFNGKFAPNERLREETLAEFLRVSRGPIREALGQLEREGLVVKEPNRGARVARLSRKDLDEVHSLRMALEKLAVREAVRNAEARHIEELESVVQAMIAALERGITPQEAARLDVRFHEVLYESTKHQRLQNFWAMLRPQIHVFLLSRNVVNADFREHIISGHQAIVDAIRSRDEARAVAVIEDHLLGAYERILQSYQETNE